MFWCQSASCWSEEAANASHKVPNVTENTDFATWSPQNALLGEYHTSDFSIFGICETRQLQIHIQKLLMFSFGDLKVGFLASKFSNVLSLCIGTVSYFVAIAVK